MAGAEQDADVIVVGAGLAGLVATAELADAGRRVILLDQEPEQSLGGQAYWSFGGLFLVDSPEQRRMRIQDSHELAWQDWHGHRRLRPRRGPLAAAMGRGVRRLRRRARSAPGCTQQGVRFFPVVGWAERGGYLATGHGNSVPRFHITWGTGPGVVEPFVRRVREASTAAWSTLRFRHRVDELTVDRRRRRRRARRRARAQRRRPRREQLARRSQATSSSARRPSSSPAAASAATTTWSARTGRSGSARRPSRCSPACPAHVDGRMLGITEAAGGRVINRDRMWHYTEGIAELGPDLARARHPHPARPVVAVARRDRQAAARRRSSPASTPSARSSTS